MTPTTIDSTEFRLRSKNEINWIFRLDFSDTYCKNSLFYSCFTSNER